MEAKIVLIEIKKQQLTAIVNAYQALSGGGLLLIFNPEPPQSHRKKKSKPSEASDTR
jgi:hypothetical protein